MSYIVCETLIFTFLPQSTNLLCVSQPYCSLHLHLHVSENPYTSGNIVSKDSAPGIIIASGEEIIWFAHPYCCLLPTLMLVTRGSYPSTLPVILFFSCVASTNKWMDFSAGNSLQNEMKLILPAHLFYDEKLLQLYRYYYCLTFLQYVTCLK